MAVVYLAEQVEPVRRQVALKVIKLGMDTKDVVTRFEAERSERVRIQEQRKAHVFRVDLRPYGLGGGDDVLPGALHDCQRHHR